MMQAPVSFPEVAGWTFALADYPCDQVGGDIAHICCCADGRLLIILGDVSGHGPAGAKTVRALRRRIQSLCQDCCDIRDVLMALNQEIHKIPGQFFTTFVGMLDPANGSLQYCCAGQDSGWVLNPHQAENPHSLSSQCIALGVISDRELAEQVQSKTLEIEPGGLLMLCTDGITESRRPHSEQEFGRRRLLKTLTAQAQAPLAEQVHNLVDSAFAYAKGHQADDATVLGIQRQITL